MAGKYGASDLGSDWITVPRKFRGRKPTSSDTELAYITGAEKGLLSRFANANQVGPSNIPSYDDSGFTIDKKGKWTPPTPTKKPGSYYFSQKGEDRGKGRTVQDIYKDVTKQEKAQGDLGRSMRDAVKKSDRYKELTKGGPGTGGGKTDIMSGPEFDDNRWKNVKEGSGDGGGDTTQSGGGGVVCPHGKNPDGSCKDAPVKGDEDPCKGANLTCPDDRPNGAGVCTDGNVDFSGCTAGEKTCPHGTDAQGNCLPPQEDDAGGPGRPSLNTILQADQAPMLQELTNDMDLRNMLTNVLNKNNPLFKQARTRALQAMAARGTVNTSMAEEAVMGAVMNVAMPIATRVIDDMQRVMAANVNASNAFKEAVNAAYYQELLKRVDAANEWNLERMKSQQVNWQKMLEAKTGAAGISDKGVFDEYMNMLKTQPGYGSNAPIWNPAG